MDTQPVIAWWYADGDRPRGPLDDDALAHLFQEGRVSLQTEVWHEGMKVWSRIACVPRLYQRLMPGSQPQESAPAPTAWAAGPAKTSLPRMTETSGNWLWQLSLALAILLILTGVLGLLWNQWRLSARQEALQGRYPHTAMPIQTDPMQVKPQETAITLGKQTVAD